MAGNRLTQFRAGIGTIGKQVTQPGEPEANGLDECDCAVAVLNVGCSNDHEQQQSDRIGDNVTFAALDLFASVIAANAPAFSGFDALAVDHSGRWTGFAALQFTGIENQKVIDGFQQTLVGPVIEIALNGRYRGSITLQDANDASLLTPANIIFDPDVTV